MSGKIFLAFFIILIMGIVQLCVFTSVLLLSNYIEVHTKPQNDFQSTKEYISYISQYLPSKKRFLDGKLNFLDFIFGFIRVNLI